MSYQIEYNKAIFYTINEKKEKVYYLFIKEGCNNVRNAYTNLRASDWYFHICGTEADIWKYIGLRMGSVEGGGLQKCRGWEKTEWYTVEEYIKQYRSKIKNAKSIASFFDTFEFKAVVSGDKDHEKHQEFEVFKEKYLCSEHTWNNTVVVEFNVNDEEVLREFIKDFKISYMDKFESFFRITKKSKRR